MDKEIMNSLNILEKWLIEISKANDDVIKGTENLRIALLNLQIEDARIKENTGIVPIANEIQDVINNLHDNTKCLITQGRKELREEFNFIKEYCIKVKEGQTI